MPEGPEVKYLTDFLNNNLKNKKLDKITINSGRYKKHGPPKGFENFVKNLPLKIKSINCYGKFIWWELFDSDITIWNTLGMSGWWTYDDTQKHNNLTFHIKGDDIYFNDMRNFGTFNFCTKDNLEKKLEKFGPDILSIDKTKDEGLLLFQKKINKKRKDTYIASALLDQGIAAGCGNYIRSEVLYLAKISPYREISNVTDEELKLIWNSLKQIGYNYYDRKLGKKIGIIDGKFKFADDYGKQFLVYKQQNDVKGNKIIREKIATRSVHYVPKLQK